MKSVSDSDNASLIPQFLEEEVKSAVWGCGSNKSPGPDVFTFKFINKMWSTLKKDIMVFMKDFHKTERIVKEGNPSFVTLIPKKSDASQLCEFRPISLIGCTYKIVAKVLANILASVMDSMI